MLYISNNQMPTRCDFAKWNFQPSGNYAEDCASGTSLAREFISMIADDDKTCAPMLQHVVAAIAAQRCDGLSGLEVAFFSYLQQAITYGGGARGRQPDITLCKAA